MSVRQLPHLQSRVLAELSDICDRFGAVRVALRGDS